MLLDMVKTYLEKSLIRGKDGEHTSDWEHVLCRPCHHTTVLIAVTFRWKPGQEKPTCKVLINYTYMT